MWRPRAGINPNQYTPIGGIVVHFPGHLQIARCAGLRPTGEFCRDHLGEKHLVEAPSRERHWMRAAGLRAAISPDPRCADFTICAKQPAASGDVDRRRGTFKVKRGRPSGRRMRCGWRCGARLTASRIWTHFTVCPGLRPRGPTRGELESQAWTTAGAGGPDAS
jgi:hypothetical protein